MKKHLPLLTGKLLQFKSFFLPKKATEQAFNLFCSPQKGRVKPYQKDFLASADSEKLITHNHEIHMYRWAGTGKTVLLLHGWESNSFRWKSLIERLQQENYNIIAADGPGQGYSSGKYLSVPLYTECAKKIIEIHKPEIIIGHSLGGMTAIYHQYKYNNPCIKQIIALGPPSELALFLNKFQEILKLSDKFMKKLDAYFFKQFGFHSKEFSIANFAKKLTIPGLLILEKRDALAPYRLSKRIHDNWKKSELFAVENIGHSLQHVSINSKIINYLAYN